MIFEFLCSFFQELAFGTVSWSYGKDSLGILQRTSLTYSVFWGILSVVWIKLIYPFLSDIIEKIPNKIGKSLTFILLFLICFDMLFSSAAVFRQTQRRNNIPATNKVQTFFDKVYPDEKLKLIYPHMSPV